MSVIESEVEEKSKYEKSLEKANTRAGKLWIYTFFLMLIYFLACIEVDSMASLWEGNKKWILIVHISLSIVFTGWTLFLSNKLYLKAGLLGKGLIDVREYITHLAKAEHTLRVFYCLLLLIGLLYIKRNADLDDVNNFLYFGLFPFFSRWELLDPMEWTEESS